MQEGICWHLLSREQHATLEPYQLPEIVRTPLEQLCLQVRALGLAERGVGAIARFCAKALTPPKPLALANALDKLQRIGALRQRDEELTPLGKPQGLKTTSLRSYSALTCTRRYTRRILGQTRDCFS